MSDRAFDESAWLRCRGTIYTQTAGSVRLVLMAVDGVPSEVLQRLPRSAHLILNALRLAGEPLGTGQVVEALGMTRPTVLRSLNALAEEGLVERIGASQKDPRAVWRLA